MCINGILRVDRHDYRRSWDMHNDIEGKMPYSAKLTDQASAALIKDLKQRGMLEDTLAIWGGEFGRTPMGQGTGRDHHINNDRYGKVG